MTWARQGNFPTKSSHYLAWRCLCLVCGATRTALIENTRAIMASHMPKNKSPYVTTDYAAQRHPTIPYVQPSKILLFGPSSSHIITIQAVKRHLSVID
jgi:hypothetical protein